MQIFTIVLPVDDGAHSWPLAPTADVIDLTEPSGEADEDLVHCLLHVSLENASSCCDVRFFVFLYSNLDLLQALILSEGLVVRK
jgi:hypothetical protein